MKDAYFETARQLKADNFPVVLAAVDATQNLELAKKENVGGYPTRKSTFFHYNYLKKCLLYLVRFSNSCIKQLIL